jgi:DNA-binding transcriptional ArsR family regulator
VRPAALNERLLDSTFAALADPTRRAILARLAHGDASVGELAEPFEFALPTISRHLKVLERARLIEKRRDASRRHCRLLPETLRRASRWIDTHTLFWESTLDSLEEFAKREDARSKQLESRSRRRK